MQVLYDRIEESKQWANLIHGGKPRPMCVLKGIFGIGRSHLSQHFANEFTSQRAGSEMHINPSDFNSEQDFLASIYLRLSGRIELDAKRKTAVIAKAKAVLGQMPGAAPKILGTFIAGVIKKHVADLDDTIDAIRDAAGDIFTDDNAKAADIARGQEANNLRWAIRNFLELFKDDLMPTAIIIDPADVSSAEVMVGILHLVENLPDAFCIILTWNTERSVEVSYEIQNLERAIRRSDGLIIPLDAMPDDAVAEWGADRGKALSLADASALNQAAGGRVELIQQFLNGEHSELSLLEDCEERRFSQFYLDLFESLTAQERRLLGLLSVLSPGVSVHRRHLKNSFDRAYDQEFSATLNKLKKRTLVAESEDQNFLRLSPALVAKSFSQWAQDEMEDYLREWKAYLASLGRHELVERTAHPVLRAMRPEDWADLDIDNAVDFVRALKDGGDLDLGVEVSRKLRQTLKGGAS